MNNMNLFGKEECKLKAEPLYLNKIYNNNVISGRYGKVVIVDNSYDREKPYMVKFPYDTDVAFKNLKNLRTLIPTVEDYDMPYDYYIEHFKIKESKNDEIGEDIAKSICDINPNPDSDNIFIRSIELEGLALDLFFCPDSTSYNYMISKKIDIDDWETIGFINYLPTISNISYMEEMYGVIKSYAREYGLFFTRMND